MFHLFSFDALFLTHDVSHNVACAYVCNSRVKHETKKGILVYHSRHMLTMKSTRHDSSGRHHTPCGLGHLSAMFGITQGDKNASETTWTCVSVSFDMPATGSPICCLRNINPLKPNLSQQADYMDRA